LFVTYPAVRASNIVNRESSNPEFGHNRRKKARPGKMYNIRLNIKKTQENALPFFGEMPYVNEG
jgi:hypothetical protein